ncbi:MAG TPA: VCBS repeat-containing protein, partial [Chitinophagaceae bacterium]|nr:VCBS repeat-containing protein [Chitinophagaceae bacterium]
MQKIFPGLLLVFFLVIGCKPDNSKLFTRLEKGSTGISFRNLLVEDEDLNVLNYNYFYNGGGVAVGDINNDGLADVLFTGNMVKNRLYLNKGDFNFEDITEKSGVAEKQGWCTGVTMVDINGDGKLDIYICRSADSEPSRRANLLFVNNGDLTFSEKAAEYGLDNTGYSTQSSFLDYDKDGDLDMFVINHSTKEYSTGTHERPEFRKQKDPAFASKLYRNDNGHFFDVSEQAGIVSNVLSFGLGIAVSDLNNDSWPDLYVSNDFNEPDYLFINNRDGTFTEKLSDCMDQVSLFSMGSDAADVNNDGLVDLLTLDMLPEDNTTQKMHSGAENFDKVQMLFRNGFYKQYSRNMLQLNNGNGTFSETAQLSGISNTDWSWTALFTDFDNDGYKDLFITNGYVKDYTDMDFVRYSVDEISRSNREGSVKPVADYLKQMPSIKTSNYVYHNKGNTLFEKRTTEWGLQEPFISSGAAYADLDNDGDMDLLVNNSNDYAGVYRNNGEVLVKNNYLKIKLDGSVANRDGIGTRVKLHFGKEQILQEQFPVRGFQSSVDHILNFGVGKSKVIDSIIITWPDNRVQKLVAVKANQKITVSLKDALNTSRNDSLQIPSQQLFTLAQQSLLFTHRENIFNDFTVQSLLPNYLSRQGPSMSKADVNKDGLEDVFIGGAKGHSSALFLQQTNGQFVEKKQAAFMADAEHEDVAAEFFDADKDQDMDLYVGSGGYEYAENDVLLQDRLYLNDGKGNFFKNEKALPLTRASTGCVKAADLDADGDLDLFVGARLVPGKYPQTPSSNILLNDGKGQFTDATSTVLPALDQLGMVTDALWTDLNNDQTPDLVVVGDWMPVKVFLNRQGKLTDASSGYIKFPSSGWWNRIAGADFDGDGDQDLVIGNLGLNAQFKAAENEPACIYYKDFDGNGTIDPVFCYYIQGVSYPAFSRDDLTEQLPG